MSSSRETRTRRTMRRTTRRTTATRTILSFTKNLAIRPFSISFIISMDMVSTVAWLASSSSNALGPSAAARFLQSLNPLPLCADTRPASTWKRSLE